MSKKLIIGILIIFGLGIGGWLYFSQYQLPISILDYIIRQPEAILPAKKLPPPAHILSDRAEKYYISSGGGYPVFLKELIIDPFFDVKEDEEQYYSIWTKDPEEIAKVTATIKREKEDKVLELQLVEGTEKEGRWEGSWIMENISINTPYKTEYRAINKNGENTILTSSWPRKD